MCTSNPSVQCVTYIILQSIKKHMGEKKIAVFVNFCLHYIANLDLPKKRCVVRAGLVPVLNLVQVTSVHVTYFSMQRNIHRVSGWSDQRLPCGQKLYSGRTHGVLRV